MTAPRLRLEPPPLRAPAERGRVVIVANRLPVTVGIDDGVVSLSPSSGGLATGLGGVHARSGGVWIGWPGVAGLSADATREVDARLDEIGAAAVPLDASEVAGFYERYANGTLWPLLHALPAGAPATPADWATYLRVNLRYAEVAGRQLRPGDRVWVHDYHLMLVPRLLRARHPRARVGFFLHTPFPGADALAALPPAQRGALLDGLLGADVVGFHTEEDAARFREAARTVLGRPVRGATVVVGGRGVHVGAFPMGIDATAFAARARDPRVDAEVARLRAAGGDGPLLVGVDRMDYTKGIPERLRAVDRFLERYPVWRKRFVLLQMGAPSRTEIAEYKELNDEVDALAAEINAKHGADDWKPIMLARAHHGVEDIFAGYRAANVCVVSSLHDGMNLVAKEFVAARDDRQGVLILSPFTGAAREMPEALLVNPYATDAFADALNAALTMPVEEQQRRMQRLRTQVAEHNIFRWAGLLLTETFRLADVESTK